MFCFGFVVFFLLFTLCQLAFRTKETLAAGHYMSVINILMQLRKVCNHPNLFDPRPVVSPLSMDGLVYYTSSLVTRALIKDPLEVSWYSTGSGSHACLLACFKMSSFSSLIGVHAESQNQNFMKI